MTRVIRTATTADGPEGRVVEPADERALRPRGLRYSLPGLVGALVFVCLSLSPSLLPRTGLIQGLVCGITGAIGYGIGVVVAWVWRAFVDRPPPPAGRRPPHIAAGAGPVCVASAPAPGGYWQGQSTDPPGAP